MSEAELSRDALCHGECLSEHISLFLVALWRGLSGDGTLSPGCSVDQIFVKGAKPLKVTRLRNVILPLCLTPPSAGAGRDAVCAGKHQAEQILLGLLREK